MVIDMDIYDNIDNVDEYYGVEIPRADEFYTEFERRNKMKCETAMKELLKSSNDGISIAIANGVLPIYVNIDTIKVDNQHSINYYWEDIEEEYTKLMNKRGWNIEYVPTQGLKYVTIKPMNWEEN